VFAQIANPIFGVGRRNMKQGLRLAMDLLLIEMFLGS
jgi:hypothetical protein